MPLSSSKGRAFPSACISTISRIPAENVPGTIKNWGNDALGWLIQISNSDQYTSVLSTGGITVQFLLSSNASYDTYAVSTGIFKHRSMCFHEAAHHIMPKAHCGSHPSKKFHCFDRGTSTPASCASCATSFYQYYSFSLLRLQDHNELTNTGPNNVHNLSV